MSIQIRRPLLALMSVLALGLAAPAVDAAVLEPIAVARHQALGTAVSVFGTVSVQSGAFDTGFAIEGLVDGIYVLDAAGAPRNVGDLVVVNGTLVDNFGLLSIQPTSVTTLAHGLPVLPQPHSTGSVGEATEGRLLSIHGEMIDALFDDSPYGFKFDIDDGSGPIQIFLYPGTGISTAGLVPGAHLHLTCFSNQFDTHYECDPRRPSDLHID
jgi:hypothetical protein